MQAQDDELHIGELLVRTDPQTSQVLIQISDRAFNVFRGANLEDLACSRSVLGSLCITDEKMAGRMCPGDQVMVDTTDQHVPAEGGVFAVVLEGRAIHCRRLSQLPDGQILLQHDNPLFADQNVKLTPPDFAKMTIAGRVKFLQGQM